MNLDTPIEFPGMVVELGAFLAVGVSGGTSRSLKCLPIILMAKEAFIGSGKSCRLHYRSRRYAIDENHSVILRTIGAGRL